MAKECFKEIRLTGMIDIKLENSFVHGQEIKELVGGGKIMEVDGINRFSADKETLCSQIVAVAEDYQKQGYSLTLRQLYYQLVSKDIIPNDMKMYQKLSPLVVDLRESGWIDWDAIVDRARTVKLARSYDSPANAIQEALDYYRVDRSNGQEHYIEIWIEKDALSDIVWNACAGYGVRLVVNKGYTSATFMYEAVQRLKEAANKGMEPVVLYMGGHDPSGIDMTRDVEERIEFYEGPDTIVDRIALTHSQVTQYHPPPNPAKLSDPRAEKYIAQYGAVSWELDALRPQVLEEIATTGIMKYFDRKIFDEQKKKESNDKDKLRKIVNKLKEDSKDDNNDDDDSEDMKCPECDESVDDCECDGCVVCGEKPIDCCCLDTSQGTWDCPGEDDEHPCGQRNGPGTQQCSKCGLLFKKFEAECCADECEHCHHQGDASKWTTCPVCNRWPTQTCQDCNTVFEAETCPKCAALKPCPTCGSVGLKCNCPKEEKKDQ